MKESLQNIKIQQLPWFSNEHVQTDILRLDLLHPVVSGNKWFKLQYYLQDAIANKKSTIATFGGAYSNHIIATAYAANSLGLESIGYIRREINEELSPTLVQAQIFGMKLVFIDRNRYRNKEDIMLEWDHPRLYWIMEGGYGAMGAKGAADILNVIDTRPYSHILCAVGTGTMMAGIIKSSQLYQHVIGISVLKNNMSIMSEVSALLSGSENKKNFSVLHNYHFGGYARHPDELLHFMKETWFTEQVPTDIVYTSKLLYAAKDLVAGGRFPEGSRLLVIHSGGLQGNQSLPPNTFPF